MVKLLQQNKQCVSMNFFDEELCMTNIVNNNAPKALAELAKKWANQGKKFHLSPDNVFYYNNAPVNYYGADDVSREVGSWSIYSENQLVPPYQFLKKEEIEEIAQAFAQETHPKEAMLFLSNRCCSRCFMCWYHGEDTSYYDNELKEEHKLVDLETAKRWVDKLAQAGIEKLNIFANGETLVIPYWEEIMKYTAQKGLKQYFITNGFFLTEEVAKKLQAIGNITSAEVSLHATDFETWSKVTRINNKKMYENAMNAPHLLKKYVTNEVYVAFVRTERNIHQYKDFLDKWLHEGFIVSSVYKMTNNDLPGNNYNNQFNEPAGLCEQMYGTIYVMPSGKVMPCGAYYFASILDKDVYKNLKTIDEYTIEELRNFNKRPITDRQKKVCGSCFSYYRRNITLEKKIFGYNATTDGVSDRVFPVANYVKKKKKTIKDRMKTELNSVKRHFNDFKNKFKSEQ